MPGAEAPAVAEYLPASQVLVLSVFKRWYKGVCVFGNRGTNPTKGFGGREGFFFPPFTMLQCKPSGAHSACMSCSSIAATVSPSIICLQS